MVNKQQCDIALVSAALKKYGVDSAHALAHYLPFKYLDYRNVTTDIHLLSEGEDACFECVLSQVPNVDFRSRPMKIKLSMFCGKTPVSCILFGIESNISTLKQGDRIHLHGMKSIWNGYTQIGKAKYVEPNKVGRIIPVYKGRTINKEKFDSDLIARTINTVITSDKTLPERIEDACAMTWEEITSKAGLEIDSIVKLLKLIHDPKTPEEIKLSRQAINDISSLYTLRKALENKRTGLSIKSFFSISKSAIEDQINCVPFKLTNDQTLAIYDICKDLSSDRPMDRVLSGDVGCGKTLAYGIPAVLAAKKGATVIILTPNTLLARQIYSEISEMFDAPVQLFLSKNKNKIVKEGAILVGTSALFGVIKKNAIEPDLLIIDEQQKLGVKQKDKIMCGHTNLLEATATAIPRTMAMLEYGSKTISRIVEQPVKKEIGTHIVWKNLKKRAFEKLKEIVEEGHQVAVLYPLRNRNNQPYRVSISEACELTSAELKKIAIESGVSDPSVSRASGLYLSYISDTRMHHRLLKMLEKSKIEVDGISIEESRKDETSDMRNLSDAQANWEHVFPGEVFALHGKLTEEEKVETIKQISETTRGVILCTSILEIGLTIPSLRGFYVVDADNYGVSTLHQLRGRVSRKGGTGTFLMGVDCEKDEIDERTLARLDLLVRLNNGFDLSAEDMHLKGFGDLSKDSVLQSGVKKGLFVGHKLSPKAVDDFIKRNSGKTLN